MKKIVVNGETKDVKSLSNLKQLMDDLNLDAAYVAVAVNHRFVARSLRATHELKEGDFIEILRPQPGG